MVENALNHGLKNFAGEKTVHISAKLREDDIIVTVADNGVGMDERAIAESLRTDDLNSATTGTSIGLRNINARLKLLHGEKYGLKIESGAGKGTKVTMTIPTTKAVIADE